MPLDLPSNRSEIERMQTARKRVTVERAMRAPFHRERLQNIDLDKLDDPQEWAKIPILDKDALRSISPDRFVAEFCIAERAQIAEYWRSGGSTGVPLFYPRTFEDMKYGRLSFERVFLGSGVGAGDTAHISFPLGIHPVGQVFARAAQANGIGVNWAGSGASTPSAMQIQLLRDLKPTAWLGMSSYGIHLANLADAEGIDLAGGSVETITCSAEPLSQAKRDKIQRMWGARVFDSFGMTEAGMMGCESDAHDGFHIFTDLYFIEVLDQDSGLPVAEGEPGLLVVTPLWTNHATTFVRWNSGDIVTYQASGKTDGPLSVFPVIRHAHRTVGFFKIRGVNINHQEFEDFMFRIADVMDFKAELVTDADTDILQVHVETATGADDAAVREQIVSETRNTFEVRPDVIVLPRGTLAREFESSVKAPRFADRRT